jgi:hypothetical protein
MLLDAMGKRPSEYTEMYPEAHCPGCKRKLYKRGGGVGKVVEHWAHYPDSTKDKCEIDEHSGEPESAWHMGLKLLFRDMGYEIEQVVKCCGKTYRIDVMLGGCAAELINSMSYKYEQKAVDFHSEKRKVIWILNGQSFGQYIRVGYCLSGSTLRFARRVFDLGQSVLVLYGGIVFGLSSSGMVYDQNLDVSLRKFALSLASANPPRSQSEFSWSITDGGR